MQGRWEVPGNFWNEGIDYNGCAQRCSDRPTCAGFDIWEGNHDCQLFFDQEHFGDGTNEEECFIKVNFASKEYTSEGVKAMFEAVDFNKDDHLDLEEFGTGYRKVDGGVSEKKIEGGFKYGDKNKDGLLEWKEFVPLLERGLGLAKDEIPQT